jgi:hypothetical protein
MTLPPALRNSPPSSQLPAVPVSAYTKGSRLAVTDVTQRYLPVSRETILTCWFVRLISPPQRRDGHVCGVVLKASWWIRDLARHTTTRTSIRGAELSAFGEVAGHIGCDGRQPFRRLAEVHRSMRALGGLYAHRLGLVRSLSNPFPPFGQHPLSAHSCRSAGILLSACLKSGASAEIRLLLPSVSAFSHDASHRGNALIHDPNLLADLPFGELLKQLLDEVRA